MIVGIFYHVFLGGSFINWIGLTQGGEKYRPLRKGRTEDASGIQRFLLDCIQEMLLSEIFRCYLI
jgi:hypothetical protein